MKNEKDWNEKRQYPRAKTETHARYRIIHGQDSDCVSKTVRCPVINVSGGGVMLGIRDLMADGLHLSFNEEIKEQNWIAIEIDLLPGRKPVRAMAQVAWYQRATYTSEYNYDVGIEFKDIGDEDQKTILDFVKRTQTS